MFDFAFPREWSTIKRLIWLKLVALQKAIEKTIIGNPIHILDALAKPAQALSIALEPIQDLHGYDNPWPAGGGKNKININREPVVFSKNPGDVIPFEDGDLIKCISRDGYLRNAVTYAVVDEKTFTVKNSNSGYGVGFVFKVTPGETYTWSATYTDGAIDISYCDSEKILSSYAVITESATSGQITIPANAAYAILILRPNAVNVVATFSYVQLEKGSTATAWTPYSNICPISGHTDADVIVSPTLDPSDGTTYPIPLGTTVYGGTLDVTTGVLTVDRAMVDLGTLTWASWLESGTLIFNAIVDGKKQQRGSTLICSQYKPNYSVSFWVELLDCEITGASNSRVYIRDQRFTDKAAFKTAMDGVQLVYELATPQTIQLTPTQVELLQGENNIWSDGEMKLVYLADGNASDVEALNILLGGRYVNNHEADEPTDREALQILLGGQR